MTTQWEEAEEDGQDISRLGGVPKRDESGEISRRELISFSAVCGLLYQKVIQAGALAEEYVHAKVAQETNSAKKFGEDAAESASRREENEAKADLVRQEAVGKFIENCTKIEELGPAQQVLAMAKMLEADPKIIEQLETVRSLIERLRIVKGCVIERRLGDEPALEERVEAADESNQ